MVSRPTACEQNARGLLRIGFIAGLAAGLLIMGLVLWFVAVPMAEGAVAHSYSAMEAVGAVQA